MSTSTSSVTTLQYGTTLLKINGKIIKLPADSIPESGSSVYAPEKK